MLRRGARLLWPLSILLLMFGFRAAACRKKKAETPTLAPGAPRLITPLLTAPPPRPTVTMWKGATRVPELPE